MEHIRGKKEQGSIDIAQRPRVFLIGFTGDRLCRIAEVLEKEYVDVTYWLTKNSAIELYKSSPNFSRTIFHDGEEAFSGRAPEGLPNDMPLPTHQIIESIRPHESEIYMLMASSEYEPLSMYKKKRLYHEYLTYWYGVLLHLKPDAVFFQDIPHNAISYIIYHLAKALNIKTVIHTDARDIPDRVLVFDDFRNYSKIAKVFEELPETRAEDLKKDIHEYYASHIDPIKKSVPVWSGKKRIKRLHAAMNLTPNMRNIVEHVKNGTLFRSIYYYLRMIFAEHPLYGTETYRYPGWKIRSMYKAWARERANFKNEYASLVQEVDWSRPYVYVALHTQPERSTSAEGGSFIDQILMLEMLARALPDGWVLYVKEHPLQWELGRTHLGRFPDYYKKIAKIQNVKLIPVKTPSLELIQKCRAVATVTGTSAWEAALLKKPSILFGFVWYMHCPGILRAYDEESCRKAFQDIKSGFAPTERDILRFLRAIDMVSVRARDRHNFNEHEFISEEETARNLAKAYYEETIS